MQSFVYQGMPSRVVFGAGSIEHVEREIERLGARRALILSTPPQRDQAEALAERIGHRAAGVFAEAVMHVPVETARAAREYAERIGADCAIAIGGGSTTGLGKAIALTSSLPILAVPTTYAGSEMTPIYGLTEAGLKKTGRDMRVLPKTVIYDPQLTVSLPASLSVTSGINAIAHAAEGLYAQDAHPIVSLPYTTLFRSRLAVRRGARKRRHVVASQAVSYARRYVQSAARGNAYHRAAARARL